MTEFLWFFGASGAGKASLIEKIAARKFMLTDVSNAVTVCWESLEFGRKERLDMLEEQLGKYALQDATVLIKGQSSDLGTSGIPYNLSQNLPNVKQRIVLVYTKPELLPQRTANRNDGYWPNANHNFESETAFQISKVEELCQTLDTQPIIVDNSAAQPRVTDKKLSDLRV
jgi:hypothetical protein